MPPKLAPEKIAEELKDPVQSAVAVGLRYVSDDLPGISRSEDSAAESKGKSSSDSFAA